MWYHIYAHAEEAHRNAYATSDGIQRIKPTLGMIEYDRSAQNNLFIPHSGYLSVVHAPWTPEQDRRYTHLAPHRI